MKKAIVTGAGGFVGSALCRALSEHGISVCAVVRNEKSDVPGISAWGGVRTVYCDSSQISLLPEIIDDHGFDTFYAIAWDGVSGGLRADYHLQLKNVQAVLDAVSAAKALGCRKFVGAGTLAEKDVARYAGLDGAAPDPVSCYGAAKLAAHFMSKAECNRCGIGHVWVQIANVYGKGDRSGNFVNYAIDTLMAGRSADFTGGSQYYDFIHIGDAARGLYYAGLDGVPNHCYYLGSGEPRRLKDYITIIRDSIDPGIQLNLGAVPYHGIGMAIEEYSCEKMEEETGFRAKVRFEDGIRERIEEYKESALHGF